MIWVLWLSGASGAMPCEIEDPPAVHLVLWERRLPNDPGRKPFGDHQKQMREELLQRLYGNERVKPLAQPGDLLAVLPEGFEQGDWYRRQGLPHATGHAQVYDYLGHALAREGDSDPVDPVFAVIGDRAELSDRLLNSVTGPMLEDWATGRDESGLSGAREHQRSVSHAEVMVHHAFVAALEHFQEVDTGCRAPQRVTLTMVSTGGRSYDIDRASDRLRGDYGIPSLDYLEHLQRDVYVLADEGWQFDKLTVYELSLRQGRVDGEMRWLDEAGSPLTLDLQGRTPEQLALGPRPTWSLPLDPGLEVQAAQAWLASPGAEPWPVELREQEGGLTLAAPEDLVRLILAERERVHGWGRGSLLPTLGTTLQVQHRAATDAGLPPVAMSSRLTVPSPQLAAALNFFTPAELGVAGALSLLLGTSLLYLGFVWTRRRTLEVEWQLEGSDIIDLAEAQDRSTVERDVTLVLRDPTPGVRARRARLDIEVRPRSFVQPQVPVTDHEAFQRLLGSAWQEEDGALHLEVTRPVPGACRDAPLTISLRHDLIDHDRVAQLSEVIAGRDHLEVVVELALRITDRRRRYRPVEMSTFQVLRLRAVAGRPSPEHRLDLRSDYAARFMPLWRHYKAVSPAFASLYLTNRARNTCPTQPVRWHVSRGTATYTDPQTGRRLVGGITVLSIDGDPTASWFLDQPCGDATERVDLGLVYPPELHEKGAPVQWLVHVEVCLGWQAPGQTQPTLGEKLERRFRIQHEDLRHAACLDFGTSSTRLLLQDPMDAAFGYLPLGEGLDTDPEDLPSEAFVTKAGEVILAPEARLQDRSTGHFVDSIKGAVLDGPGSEATRAQLESIVSAVLRQAAGPLLAAEDVEVLKPSAAGAMDLRLGGGDRRLLVATLPNDADPRYEAALLAGIRSSGVFDGAALMLLHEAEAVALWKASEVFGAPIPGLGEVGDHLNILVVDYGAGTSDAALVRVWRPAAGRQEIEVLSTGGARIGGRDIDGAFFDALAAEAGQAQLTWAALRAGREALRPQMEAYKLRASAREWMHIDLPLRVKGHTIHLNAPLFDVAAREEIDRVLERMARMPLAVLLGRRPIGQQNLDDVDLVVLTGRAAQTPRLERFVRNEVGMHASSPPVVDMAPRHLLKAAVTLGARRYAQGLGGSFRPSHSVFRDRLVYLWLDERGVARCLNLMEAGVETRGGGHEVVVSVPRASIGGIYQTWMVPLPEGKQADPARPWELGQEQARLILDGQSIDQLPGEQPAVPVAWQPDQLAWRPRADSSLWALIKLVIDSDHHVRAEPADA